MKTRKVKSERKPIKETISNERTRLMMTYRMLVQSVREARSMQGVVEKDQQMQRVLHQLRQTSQPQA